VVVPRDEAIALLWDRYHSELVRLATGLVAETGTGEEIVQEAFAALLRRWRQLRDPSAAHAYLRRVVVNEARRRWRHRARAGQALALALVMREPDLAEAADADFSLDLVAALARLPKGKRACVVLRYYADLPETEVAQLLGVTVGTVKSQTAKGLRQLADVLADQRSDHDETQGEAR
jgi:RNA polymerase sigma-70 factor (sigma-E family)